MRRFALTRLAPHSSTVRVIWDERSCDIYNTPSCFLNCVGSCTIFSCVSCNHQAASVFILINYYGNRTCSSNYISWRRVYFQTNTPVTKNMLQHRFVPAKNNVSSCFYKRLVIDNAFIVLYSGHVERQPQ